MGSYEVTPMAYCHFYVLELLTSVIAKTPVVEGENTINGTYTVRDKAQ